VITRIVQKLVSAGYLTREQSGSDGRAWTLTITETGRKLSDYVELEFFKEMQTAIDDLDESELAILKQALPILERVALKLHARSNDHLSGLGSSERSAE
jgi:DNA-binding MarR family transcriptional regulator